MSSAVTNQVFSVPFRHLWSTNFSGEQSVNECSSLPRPLGLARFVGDEPNELLRYFVSDAVKHGKPAHPSVDSDSVRRRIFALQSPLVLFGPAGTGKTSLAMTVISDLAECDRQDSSISSSKPVFMTALDFDRRFRSALETDSVFDFRKRLIQSAGWVIDDLHKLLDKTATQNEFVLILDEMCRKNRPVIITMDSAPQQSIGLSAQLVSRLSGGLSLPVNPPGPSARLEIIRDLAKINQVKLSDNAARLLVDHLNVTVPKLDHFFAQIKTAIRADDSSDPCQEIDVARLTQMFSKSESDLDQLARMIVKKVALEFHLKVSELKSNSRKQSIVLARGVAIYLNRVLLCTSFLKIGTYFGNRDHSTIMHAFRKINKLVDGERSDQDVSSIKNVVEKLKQQLTELFASQINFI